MKTQNRTVNKDSFGIIIYAMMIVAVIYVIVQTLLGNNNDMAYKLTLGLWILAAVIVNDFVEPMVQHEFDNMGKLKAQLYVMYSIADAAAYAFVYVFIINISYYLELVHYIFLAMAIVLFVVKTLLYKKYTAANETGEQTVENMQTEDTDETSAIDEEPNTACDNEEYSVNLDEEDDIVMNNLEDEDDIQVFRHRAR